jgi:hypothetical protein
LRLPDVVEDEHMSHPDFRVAGKIFATLSADRSFGVVMLTPEQQKAFLVSAAAAFKPVNGAWERRGCTQVALDAVAAPALRDALATAWLNKAPKDLAIRMRGRKRR